MGWFSGYSVAVAVPQGLSSGSRPASFRRMMRRAETIYPELNLDAADRDRLLEASMPPSLLPPLARRWQV